jgi:dolichyl-phosphate-mannose--protein O-mannosyl transferase
VALGSLTCILKTKKPWGLLIMALGCLVNSVNLWFNSNTVTSLINLVIGAVDIYLFFLFIRIDRKNRLSMREKFLNDIMNKKVK